MIVLASAYVRKELADCSQGAERLGHMRQAIDGLREAVVGQNANWIRSTLADHLARYAFQLVLDGEDSMALESARELVGIQPDSQYYESILAHCYLASGRRREAIAAYGDALALRDGGVDGMTSIDRIKYIKLQLYKVRDARALRNIEEVELLMEDAMGKALARQ